MARRRKYKSRFLNHFARHRKGRTWQPPSPLAAMALSECPRWRATKTWLSTSVAPAGPIRLGEQQQSTAFALVYWAFLEVPRTTEMDVRPSVLSRPMVIKKPTVALLSLVIIPPSGVSRKLVLGLSLVSCKSSRWEPSWLRECRYIGTLWPIKN